MTNSTPIRANLTVALEIVTASPDHIVLHRLVPPPVKTRPKRPDEMLAILLDVETTGLSHSNCEIIELGMVAVTFDNSTGQFLDVIGTYTGFSEPVAPIPERITMITGITDAMVIGQSISEADVAALVIDADLIVAHNASFDRPFFDKAFPSMSNKSWACSMTDVDWVANGFDGAKLGHLLMQAGYFHEGHRAINDCWALLEVLRQKSVVGEGTLFKELLKVSQRPRLRLTAKDSPFDMKDHLKARGYRWNGGSEGGVKGWWIEIDPTQRDAEVSYLRDEIYARRPDLDFRELAPETRFRSK
jgi:DNA polymerase-3 subunit epsilon